MIFLEPTNSQTFNELVYHVSEQVITLNYLKILIYNNIGVLTSLTFSHLSVLFGKLPHVLTSQPHFEDHYENSHMQG